MPSINRAELRPDGWWLIFELGEEAGPFEGLDQARAFLDYVDCLQQAKTGVAANREKPVHSDSEIEGLPGLP